MEDRWNICNVLIKTLAIYIWTDETFWTNSCNMSLKHLQHVQYPYETTTTYLWKVWNTWNIYLQHRGGGVPMPVNSGRRGGSRRQVAAREHIQHQRHARWHARRGASERWRIRHAAAARGVRVRVQDEAATRRFPGWNMAVNGWAAFGSQMTWTWISTTA
jgi:hypothetical protein